MSLVELELGENYDLDDRLKEEIAACLVRNRRLPALFLRRYQLDSGPPLHWSRTSMVRAAVDCCAPHSTSPSSSTSSGRVALKFFRSRASMYENSMLAVPSYASKFLDAVEPLRPLRLHGPWCRCWAFMNQPAQWKKA